MPRETGSGAENWLSMRGQSCYNPLDFMKGLILALFLLGSAIPVLARDEGGDGVVIPSFQELVREGFGPHISERPTIIIPTVTLIAAPKPTQAYYMKERTVYYGFVPLAVRSTNTSTIYAFGYPLDFYRKLMPPSITDINLSRYSVSVPTNNARPVTPVHPPAISTVKKVTSATTTVAPATQASLASGN